MFKVRASVLSAVFAVAAMGLMGCAADTEEPAEDADTRETAVDVETDTASPKYAPRVTKRDIMQGGGKCTASGACILYGSWDCSGGGYCTLIAR